jgi:hypothetical protein
LRADQNQNTGNQGEDRLNFSGEFHGSLSFEWAVGVYPQRFEESNRYKRPVTGYRFTSIRFNPDAGPSAVPQALSSFGIYLNRQTLIMTHRRSSGRDCGFAQPYAKPRAQLSCPLIATKSKGCRSPAELTKVGQDARASRTYHSKFFIFITHNTTMKLEIIINH